MQLAERAGVAQPTVSALERGGNTSYRAHVLFKIAAALETTPEYLMHGVGSPDIDDATASPSELQLFVNSLDDHEQAMLLSVARSIFKK